MTALTNAEHQRRHREKRAARLRQADRMEAALRRIAARDFKCSPHQHGMVAAYLAAETLNATDGGDK